MFCKLKECFENATVLQYFNSEKKIWIETNASDYIIVEVLLQPCKDSANYLQTMWKPVACYSQRIIDSEHQYWTSNQEMLAIVNFFKK